MRKLLLFLLFTALLVSPAHALTRTELRAAWQEISQTRADESPYLETPNVKSFNAGSLSDAAQRDALNVLNFLRRIAGLDAIALNPLYSLRAQNGALLLAANDQLDHNAPQPAGMDDAQYESAHMGTSLGNIVKFNWMKNDILIDAVRYFARDDGESNLSVLGHRRWLLNPAMAQTGFGLANAESGMSYAVMYAVDMENTDADWEYVAWPAAEAFPVEMMRSNLAWSLSLNEEYYDLSTSQPQVSLKEEISGAQFNFDISGGTGDGYCTLSTENYGSGSCIIFRPDIEKAGIIEYVQNQIWTVEVRGLRRTDGSECEISYRCEMVSLYPQDVANIELSTLEAELHVGETLQLNASIIPAYADDLNIIWGSSDPGVASVTPGGLVTAVAPGACQITAMSANGRKDICEIKINSAE